MAIDKKNAVRKPQQQRSQDRIDRILEASKKIIAEKGSAGLTISGIADEAGITAGSMYQYFPNKQAIVFRLGELYLQAVKDQIAQKLDVEMTCREDLYGVLFDILDDYTFMHESDPVVRDIWLGFIVNKEMRDIDWENTVENAAAIAHIATPLFPEAMHSELEAAFLLIVQYADATTLTAVASDPAVKDSVVSEGRKMLGVLLDNLETRALDHEKA